MTLFARIGEALYGERRFIRALAARLDVDVRTVERWASGEFFPPQGVWRELETLVRAQNRESFALLGEIRKVSLGQQGKTPASLSHNAG